MAEWLRRWTANPLGSPRVGSNPILVENFLIIFNKYLTLVFYRYLAYFTGYIGTYGYIHFIIIIIWCRAL